MAEPKRKLAQATECHIAWKVIETGVGSHGPWRKISDEIYVKHAIQDLDRTNSDRIEHFIEYQ